MAVCDRCCFETFCEHGVLRVVGVKECCFGGRHAVGLRLHRRSWPRAGGAASVPSVPLPRLQPEETVADAPGEASPSEEQLCRLEAAVPTGLQHV